MKAGKVLTLRIRPEDILTAFDVVKLAGADPTNYSLASITNSALSISFATLRKLNLVPTRDGFEYSEVLSSWEASRKARSVQLETTTTLSSQVLTPLPTSTPQEETDRKEIRIEELRVKKQFNPKKWTAKDEAELSNLTGE